MGCRINLRAGHGWGNKDVAALSRRFTIAEAAAGQAPLVRLDRHQARDKLGRFGHSTGHAFFGSLTVTGVAATMPTAMPGYLYLSLLSQMSLQAGGREHFVSIDGADLYDDMIIREGMAVSAGSGGAPADLPDANATVVQPIVLLWTYGRPHSDERMNARCLDCAIPLSLFNANADTEAGLRFTIAAAPTSGGGETDAFPGVTSTGWVTAADPLEVYTILRYEDEMHVDVPWQVRRVAGTELTGRYVAGALCHYLVVRDRVNTAGSWVPTHVDYGVVEVTAGDERVVAGLDGQTALVIARRANIITALDSAVSASQGMAPANSVLPIGAVVVDLIPRSTRMLTTGAPEFLPLIWSPTAARRATHANGDVSWVIGARTGHLRTRVLMRGYGDYDVNMEIKARACMPGLGSPDDQRETAAGTTSPKAGSIANFLPVAIREAPPADKKAA